MRGVLFYILLCCIVNCWSDNIASNESDSEENEIGYNSEPDGNSSEDRDVISSPDKRHHHKKTTTARPRNSKTKYRGMDIPILGGREENEGVNWSSDFKVQKDIKENTTKREKETKAKTSANKSTRRYFMQSDNTDGKMNIRSSENCPFEKNSNAEKQQASTLVNYPFVVSILRKGSHYATGALLDRNWVLSCAGEFYNVMESMKLFRARLGSVDNKHGGTLVPLKRIVIHPSYVNKEPNFDLAMLRLAKPITYNHFVKPISVSKFASKVIGGKFLTTYWARLIVKGEPLPTTASERIRHTSLRMSTQSMITPPKCKQLLRDANITFDDSTFCLKPFAKYHSLCVPDAGAPVIGEDGIWGITSGWTSANCLHEPSPYTFCRLSSPSVQAWMDKELQDSRK